MSAPTPGLHGNYAGTCVVCLKPTDTLLGSRGEAEWHVAFLSHLGVPMEQATSTIAPDGQVQDGIYEQLFRVCVDCVSAANPKLPAPVVHAFGTEVPTIEQKGTSL